MEREKALRKLDKKTLKEEKNKNNRFESKTECGPGNNKDKHGAKKTARVEKSDQGQELHELLKQKDALTQEKEKIQTQIGSLKGNKKSEEYLEKKDQLQQQLSLVEEKLTQATIRIQYLQDISAKNAKQEQVQEKAKEKVEEQVEEKVEEKVEEIPAATVKVTAQPNSQKLQNDGAENTEEEKVVAKKTQIVQLELPSLMEIFSSPKLQKTAGILEIEVGRNLFDSKTEEQLVQAKSKMDFFLTDINHVINDKFWKITEFVEKNYRKY